MPVAADIFRRAAEANRRDALRRGSTVHLDAGALLVSGDIHGHRVNLVKILDAAHLAAEGRRLVLQEIIHAPPDARRGQDRSVDALLRVARTQLEFPGRLHTVLSNHDIAQFTGGQIAKGGHDLCEAFRRGVAYAFGDDADEVYDAVCEYLRSQPLAVRTAGGVLITHSLPDPRRMDRAGTDILDRPATDDDCRRGGAVYEWTWGRGHSDQQLARLADQLGLSFFIFAHRALNGGYEVVGPHAICLNSDEANGCVMAFGAAEALSAETAEAAVRPIAML